MVEFRKEEPGNNQLNPQDIDMFLKQKLVDMWGDATNFYIMGDYVKSFNAYKSLFRLIRGYNFDNKEYLKEIVDITDEYMDGLKGKPLNVKALLEFNNKARTFKDLMDKFMDELPLAFIQLNLWFRSVPLSQDVDVDFSNETFGDELTLINRKRKELKKLSVEQLIDLMTINELHGVYAKARRYNVL